MQQHQGEQAGYLRVVGHQRLQHAPQADRLGAQVLPQQRRPGGRRIPLGEDQVDDRQHRGQPVGQLVVIRHAQRDACPSQLPLCSHQPLLDGVLGGEHAAGDLGGRQPAHHPQGEGRLRFDGQRRVAACEDQPQALVGDHLHVLPARVFEQSPLGRTRQLGPAVVERPPAAEAIQRPVAGRGRDPSGRILDGEDPLGRRARARWWRCASGRAGCRPPSRRRCAAAR
jgi:hypothetical protein